MIKIDDPALVTKGFHTYTIVHETYALNRRDAGGATDFEAIITYPDTETYIPSKYKYTYTFVEIVLLTNLKILTLMSITKNKD